MLHTHSYCSGDCRKTLCYLPHQSPFSHFFVMNRNHPEILTSLIQETIQEPHRLCFRNFCTLRAEATGFWTRNIQIVGIHQAPNARLPCTLSQAGQEGTMQRTRQGSSLPSRPGLPLLPLGTASLAAGALLAVSWESWHSRHRGVWLCAGCLKRAQLQLRICTLPKHRGELQPSQR